MSSRRALVIDDSATTRRFHRDILESAGFAVAEAVNGLDGLERVMAEAPFDVALVDLNMPLLDGCGFLRRLRRLATQGDLPVIMASTERAEGDADRAFAAGANLYLIKPVAPEALTRLALAIAGPGPGNAA